MRKVVLDFSTCHQDTWLVHRKSAQLSIPTYIPHAQLQNTAVTSRLVQFPSLLQQKYELTYTLRSQQLSAHRSVSAP